ncbi:MAG: LptF/LptG family permease [Epsilonproteobacteria bacterium]|nr:LptF/LptG family permease [Campylobacterota bacterium]
MYQLRNYIIKHISALFFSFYMPIFVIASVAILIKLAKMTAIIHLTIMDMVNMYLFLIPEILFYTLPIIFVVASAIALFRLSNDNETIVIFALGISPKFLLKTIFKPAFLLFLLLIFDFFIVLPHATIMYRNFREQKIQETQFNLSASEFGHKFGNWLLFIGKKEEDGTMKNLFLFNSSKQEEVLISAKKGYIINHDSVLTLKLLDGEGYSYSKKLFTQTEYETMFINNSVKSGSFKYEKPLDYWTSDYRRKNKDKKIVFGILFSLFPITSLYFILSLGILNARHQKSKIYLYLFLGIMFYFIPTLTLQKILGFYTIPVVLTMWIVSTYLLYKRTILKRF